MAGQLPCTRSPSACCTNTSTGGSVSAASRSRPDRGRARRGARPCATPADADHEHQRRREPDLAADQLAKELQSPRRVPGAGAAALLGRSSPNHARRSTAAPAGTSGASSAARARARPRAARPARRARPAARAACRRHSSAAVYLLAIARPANRPTASNHLAAAHRASSRASAQSAAVQKNSSGVSGVIVTRPDAEQQRGVEQRGGDAARRAGRATGVPPHPPAATSRARPQRPEQPDAQRACRRPAASRP